MLHTFEFEEGMRIFKADKFYYVKDDGTTGERTTQFLRASIRKVEAQEGVKLIIELLDPYMEQVVIFETEEEAKRCSDVMKKDMQQFKIQLERLDRLNPFRMPTDV